MNSKQELSAGALQLFSRTELPPKIYIFPWRMSRKIYAAGRAFRPLWPRSRQSIYQGRSQCRCFCKKKTRTWRARLSKTPRIRTVARFLTNKESLSYWRHNRWLAWRHNWTLCRRARQTRFGCNFVKRAFDLHWSVSSFANKSFLSVPT